MNQPIERRLSDARSPSKSRSATRRLLERLLHGRRDVPSSSRGRLLLETLESRQLLAGDVEMFSTDPSAVDDSFTPAQFDTTGMQAEGEATNDLVAFAKALTDAGVTFYGAAWCPVCLQQKTLFGDGKEELPFVEVTNPDQTLNAVGVAEDISQFPTWEFPDSSRELGLLSLAEISERSGVAIPQSENPSFAPVGNQTVEIGSPLHIPIDAYDPDDDSMTVTVSVADPSLLAATVLDGNRSARINVQGWGSMTFELFEDRAPRAAARFIELAEAGFYDADGDDEVIFHRIIDNFVLQAGDPTGTGSGGSTLGDFDDNFHPDLQHNRSGILSYAKSFDDTNDSQFFITEKATRHLDFNHSIFGQMVEGEIVREAISETKTTSNRPDIPVVIDSVEIFDDSENSILMLKPTGNGTGQTDVTITVTDGDGNVFSEVITVTITPDAVDAAPFLGDIAPVTTTSGTPAEIQLNGIDAEGDTIVYEARVIDSSGATATVNQSTGRVTVTPADNFSGEILVEVAARSPSTPTSTDASTRSSEMDLQVVTVNVGPAAPAGITLGTSSDSGSSNSDGITNDTPLRFTVTGVTPGATVEIMAGDIQVGAGTATSSTIVITTNNFATLGNAVHLVTARQTVGGIRSAKSPSITLTFDPVAPALSPVIPSQASVGVPYLGNMQNAEEGSGLQYTLSSGPAGLTVDSASGAITWTPTEAQEGDQELVVTLTDAAGNSRDQTYTINVGADPLVTIRLEAVDLEGNVITELVPGQEFKINVYGNDERGLVAQGVFSLYTDLIFDGTRAEVVEDDPFEYDALYSNAPLGTATAGLIDEAGAFASQTTPFGPGEKRIFSVQMRALTGGNLTIASDPADGGSTEVSVFDESDEILDNRIVYGALSLTVNATFTAVNDSATVAEDSEDTTIDALANDTLITSGTTLTITDVSTTSEGGTVTISGNSLRYSPPADFVGIDEFTYTVSDQNGGLQTATVSVSVQGENDPPTAAADTLEVVEDSTLNRVDVLANDTAAPDTGETLEVTAVSATSEGGAVTIGSSGTHVLYTPPDGFTGTDTFTYTVSDGTSTDTETVTITVIPDNPPPTAVDDSFTLAEDADAADYDVFANDTNDDPENPDETFALVSVGSTDNGTVSRTADGKLRYKPNANFFGVDEVTYTIRDSGGANATGTVTFTVTAVNDPPPAPALSFQTSKGTSNVEVLDVDTLNQSNIDGTESLDITAVGTPSAGGSVTIASDGQSILYTPPTAEFTGDDTVTYTVTDPAGTTTTGTLTITVLDFIPRDFVIELDGLDSAAVNYFTNLTATLTGTDFRGENVSLDATFHPPNASHPAGFLSFSGQAPGTYEVELPAIPFLQNAQSPQRFTFSSAVDDPADMELTATLGSLMPEYLSIRDFLGSTPASHLFAVVRMGQTHSWVAATNNSTTPGNPVVTLSADGQQVRIEVDATGGGRRAATLAVTDSRVDVRASEGEFRLLRIHVDPAVVTYTAVSSSSAAADESGDSGEGEAATTTSTAQMSTQDTSSSQAGSSSQAELSDPATDSDTANITAGNGSGSAAEGESADEPVSQLASDGSSATADTELRPAPMAQQLAAEGEGEATPPLDSPGGEMPSIGREASSQSPLAHRSLIPAATHRDDTSGGDTSDSSSRPLAVDWAMLDLLPQLERRSTTAEALADREGPLDLTAIDRTFDLLAEEGTL